MILNLLELRGPALLAETDCMIGEDDGMAPAEERLSPQRPTPDPRVEYKIR